VISLAETLRALTGAWRLLRNEPDALRYFDTSAEGFWRSFAAIVFIFPAYLLTALADRQAMLADPTIAAGNDGLYWIAKIVSLGLDWVSLPILLAALAGFLDMKRQYPVYIVVRNWATVLMMVPFAAISLLDLFGVVPVEVMLLPSLAALGFTLWFGYLIARRTLQVGVDVAVGIVVLDFLVSIGVVRIVGRIFGIDLGV
jgi:hypothetical protein